MAFTGTAAAIGGGLSLASLGMKAGSDVAAGYAKSAELQTKAQNYALEAATKATNYKLQGDAAATNYRLSGDATATNALLQGRATAANARYQGGAQAAQFGIQSTEDLMRESEARTAADFGDLKAAMTDASARQTLAQTLGNIATIRAAGGADFTSPTTAALESRAYNVAELNRTATEASINAQSAEERAAADYLHQASAFALQQGQAAQTMGEFNAKTAETYADFNANTAKSYADYNAGVAKSYADFNAAQALKYGQFNYNAAESAAGTAVNMGFMGAGADILGGLGKAFSGGLFGVPGADGVLPGGKPLGQGGIGSA